VYSIGLYAGDPRREVTPWESVCNPVLSREQVSDVSARFVADPFMVRVDDRWYMFFEVYNVQSKKGEIGLATSEDARQWRYERIVLREAFHLSYPYVFEWEGAYYMVPEASQTSSVRLYEAVHFPHQWVYRATLLEGRGYVDPCVFRLDRSWWLFACHGEPPFRADTLRLFQADTPLGPWREHPQSPVIPQDKRVARPAGRVIVTDGKAVRFGQDCHAEYGVQVYAFEVSELTSERYHERPVGAQPLLGASGSGWNAAGMHHIDPHLVRDDQWLACVDGWAWERLDG
jgi:hypothetical protein